MNREPDHLSRCDRILDDDGRLLGAIYYSGAGEMARFRAWFDGSGNHAADSFEANDNQRVRLAHTGVT